MTPLFKTRRARVLLAAAAVVMLASGCVEEISPAFTPKPAAAYTDIQWAFLPLPGDYAATAGYLASKYPTRWTVVLLPGGGGCSSQDLNMLRELSWRGVNVVYACYFEVDITEAEQIQTIGAPAGDMWDPAIADIDAVVNGAKQLYPGTQIAVAGASMSGYWALARAAAGRREPIIDIAGNTGPIIPVAGQITAPTLILHGSADGFILPSDSQALYDAMVGARRTPELVWIPGGTHGMMMEPWSQALLAHSIASWLSWH